MFFNMFPYIDNGWVIRGTQEIPRLYNIYTNKVVKLNADVLKYIIVCTGCESFNDIMKKYDASPNEMQKFYSQFLKEKIIIVSDQSTYHPIDISMGEKEPWLKEVHIDITNNCNLRCKHCFWGENLKCEKNFSYSKWVDAIDDFKKAGVGRIVFSGGEAFTYAGLLEVIKKCNESKIMVASIFTNGTIHNVITENIVKYITLQGLNTTFYISLDGYTKEQNDFIRGEGQFEKTISFIRYLVTYRKESNAKYKILVNSLIHKKNYTDLVSWYEFLTDLGVDGWRFTTGRESGFLKKNANNVKVGYEDCFKEYIRLIKYVLQKYKSGQKTLYVNVENFFNSRMIETKKAYIFDQDLCICDYKSQACSVDPYGNVQFCTGWQNEKYGNIFETDISSIWYAKKMRQMKEFKIGDIVECRGCKYLSYCGGGCRLECDNIYAKDEAICQSFALFERYIVPLLKENDIIFTI